MENNNYNYYQQPQQPAAAPVPPVQAPKKEKKTFLNGKLGKQHLFVGGAVALSYIIPWIGSGIYTLLTNLLFGDSYYGYGSSDLSWMSVLANLEGVIVTLLTLAAAVVFGYLAYKNIRGAACFAGAVFVATKVSGFITGFFSTFISIIGVIVAAVDSYAYYDFTAVSGVINGIFSFIGMVLAVAVGIFLLMIVEKGKIKFDFKKKAKPVVPAQPVAPVQPQQPAQPQYQNYNNYNNYQR